MIVLQLTDCPIGLRGELTKWLFEISAGVFVGQVSARVRDKLWMRITETRRSGRAVLVYSTNNEQKLDFKICGETWEPIDFDGLKLVLRPNAARLNKSRELASGETLQGFSEAAKHRAAKRFSSANASKRDARYPTSYVVLDLETTGLNSDRNEIIEIGAIKVVGKEKTDIFHKFIQTDSAIVQNITNITGITDELLQAQGQPLGEVLSDFVKFLGELAIVAHNIDFDRKFLQNACVKSGIERINNRCIDTLVLSRRLLKGRSDYKLGTLAKHFDISSVENAKICKSMRDCDVTYLLYEKLMNLIEGEK